MVASDAISRARVDDRGVVVNTMKYDIELEREKVAGWGADEEERKEGGIGALWLKFSQFGATPTREFRTSLLQQGLRHFSDRKTQRKW